MEWLWGFGAPGIRKVFILDSGWGSTDLANNLGVFLGSWLVVGKQVAAMSRGALAQICLVHQFCPFLEEEPLLTDLSHLLFGLLQYTLHGAALEDYAEVITGPERSATHSFHCPSVHLSNIIAT